MSEQKTKKYSNGEITVIWKPDVCIHSGECVKGSPEVFKPKERPWIQMEKASTGEIKKTIDHCPSGALSYRMKNAAESEAASVEALKVKITPKGPILVYGSIEVEKPTGEKELCTGKTTALCRCGASENKPFCDGSHKSVNFEG